MRKTRALLCALSVVATLGALLPGPSALAASAAKSIKFPCKQAGLAQVDPIVNPDGSTSAHLHVFLGNLGVPMGVHTYDEAIQQDTTCKHEGDTAAYWAPVMLQPDGTPVEVKGTAYYDRMTSQKIVPFPPDFGMIFGSVRGVFNPKQRSYYGWNCRNSDPLQPDFSMVDCRSFSGGQAYVTYRSFSPYCWDGVIPADRNYGDHVFYPDNYPKNAMCPDGAKVLPRLRVNFNFKTPYCPDCYVSSDPMMGTTAGASVHTDYWNTWQQSDLEALVDQLNA